jgi:hypothetical protein
LRLVSQKREEVKMDINKLLVKDIVDKVKSEDFDFGGYVYHNYNYHLNGFHNDGKSFRIWTLETADNSTIMELNFNDKEIRYNSNDDNASEIANILSINGWKM